MLTEETRAVLKWGGILLAIALLGFTSYNILRSVFFPKKEAPPTVTFGKLPPLVMPQSVTDRKLSYSLTTIDGELPKFPDRTDVFTIVEPQPTLLGLDVAHERAASGGFATSGASLSDTLYYWKDDSSIGRELFFDTVSFNFAIKSNFAASPDVLSARDLPNESSAIEQAQSFLADMDSFPADIDVNKTKTSLFSIENQTLVPATSLSTTQVIRVDFYQKDINNIPIYHPHPPHSTIYVHVASTGDTRLYDKGNIVEAGFTYQEAASPSATYPIKTAKQAFDDLQSGKAYIASYFGSDDSVNISQVSLGYYLSDSRQQYLLPIVVFIGDEGFFAYVSAVMDEWIRK